MTPEERALEALRQVGRVEEKYWPMPAQVEIVAAAIKAAVAEERERIRAEILPHLEAALELARQVKGHIDQQSEFVASKSPSPPPG